MLDPATGKGEIIDFASSISKKLKILGIEEDKKIAETTKELFSKNKNINIINGNFLESNFNNNDFDLIIMKTPETIKDHYFKYIFKVLRLMRQSKITYKGDTVNFILICPKMEIENEFDLNQLVAENKSLSYDTFNNIYYSMTGNFISPREFKELAPKLEQDLRYYFDDSLTGSLIGTSGNLGVYLLQTN